jgi:uncharacterized phage protein (TIGR01671 family)
MREIKFRAWDKKTNKVMYEVQLLEFKEAGGGISACWTDGVDFDNGDELNNLGDLVLMQYTGLKDKKRTKEYPEGQEIYEGDIVDEYSPNGRRYDLRYRVGFGRGHFTLTEIGGGYDKLGIWNVHKELEVIGNIYENPELLEEKDGSRD